MRRIRAIRYRKQWLLHQREAKNKMPIKNQYPFSKLSSHLKERENVVGWIMNEFLLLFLCLFHSWMRRQRWGMTSGSFAPTEPGYLIIFSVRWSEESSSGELWLSILNYWCCCCRFGVRTAYSIALRPRFLSFFLSLTSSYRQQRRGENKYGTHLKRKESMNYFQLRKFCLWSMCKRNSQRVINDILSQVSNAMYS